MITKEEIRERILRLGADVCGFGGVERFAQAPSGFPPTDLYADCKCVISVGAALPKGLYCVDSRLIYGHFNADIVHKVDEIVLDAAKIIEKECGGVCMPRSINPDAHVVWIYDSIRLVSDDSSAA